MSHTLDLLFVLGVIANVVKLADILLRKQQRERFESALETLTLRMDYARPLLWFRALVEPARWPALRAVLVAASVLTFASLVLQMAGDAMQDDKESSFLMMVVGLHEGKER